MDIEKIRAQFPILQRTVGEMGMPLVYLDNTASSQTPERVVKAIINVYEHAKANVHRGVHTVSQEATERMEHTRTRVCRYINASSPEEIIFTRGTTEAINLVAYSYAGAFTEGDEIILTVMEHHANIVSWQLATRGKGVKLRVVGINPDGSLDMEQYRSLFNKRTRMVSFCHISNVLGTVNPVKEMTDIAHSHGVPVLIDGAQAAPHMQMDVQDIGCDFYAFSSHKMYGPTGVGILYGRKELLENMSPWQGGGEMISHVSFEHTTWADLPYKFEAGTPDYVDIAAFSHALDFIEEIGIDNIREHEHRLTQIATKGLLDIGDITIYGTTPDKAAVISFLLNGVHPYDVGMLLDQMGMAVRTGHHCAQPLMDTLGITGTVRASFAAYNTEAEVDAFLKAMRRIKKIFKGRFYK